MKIGIQISSLKPLLTTGARVHAAARRLNEIGFRYSQLQWIDPSVTPEEIAKAMSENGITVLGTQEKYKECVRRLDNFIGINLACNANEVCFSGIDESYEGIRGLNQYIEEMHAHIDRLALSGVRASFHPVKGDFRKIGNEHACEILLREIPKMEIVPDTNQLLRAGQDAGKWLLKHAGRMRMIHFKDMESLEENAPLTPAGRGCTDYASLIPYIQESGIEYILIEQEKWDMDPFEAMKIGYDFVKGLIGE
ncbi:MAG: sugar phosphate isomerase/epimerase [Clostridia bacterium]|nr:sugar phosphate isomerase/epimerase [Clostridia bacterium]